MVMRTTLTLDDEVAAAVERIRREEGVGPSEAVNRLAKAGLVQERLRGGAAKAFQLPEGRPLGLKIDVTSVGDALNLLDELEGRQPRGPHAD